MVGMAVFMVFDYRHLQVAAWPLFVLTLCLLVGTLFFARSSTARGAGWTWGS
jgi:rod shape determining protein RodA